MVIPRERSVKSLSVRSASPPNAWSGCYSSSCDPRPAEGAGELGEDRQVGVQPNTVQSAHSQRRERPFVLEPSELALDCATGSVEGARAGGLTRERRVQ